MGRLILKYKSGKLESFKCKSKERAKEIFDKRPNAIKFDYFKDGERITLDKKKIVENIPLNFEELELLMKQQRLI